MILLPAIDLIGGQCVRLRQGDFARVTAYAADPSGALAAFAETGAAEAHLVDLDGARDRCPRQHDLFVMLAGSSRLALQVAGGFRTSDQVARVLEAGVNRVVIGSLAFDDPESFDDLLDRFGSDRIVLALDVRLSGDTPFVSAHGWTTDSDRTLADLLDRFDRVRHLLVTDISRDGMLGGPNTALMRAIATSYPEVALQASGGVAGLADLDALARTGAARAIVGKALWEGRFTVAEALRHAGG